MIPGIAAALGPMLRDFAGQAAQSAAAGVASDLVGRMGGGGSGAGGAFKASAGLMAMPGGQVPAAMMAGVGLTRGAMGLAGDALAAPAGAAGSFASSMGNKTEGAVLSDLGEHVSLLSDKFAKASTSINPADWIELGSAVIGTISSIESWGDALTASAQHLQGFSGEMAVAAGIQRKGAMERSIKEAQATGGSTLDMTRAIEKLKDVMQPMRVDITNITNDLMTEVIGVATEAAKLLKDLYDWSKKAAIGWAETFKDFAAAFFGVLEVLPYIGTSAMTAGVLIQMSIDSLVDVLNKDRKKVVDSKLPQREFLQHTLRLRELFDPMSLSFTYQPPTPALSMKKPAPIQLINLSGF